MIYKTLLVSAMALVGVQASTYTCSCSGCDSAFWCDSYSTYCDEVSGSFSGNCDDDNVGSMSCAFDCSWDDDAIADDFTVDDSVLDASCEATCLAYSCTGYDVSGSCSSSSDDDTCFHADTVITYKGKQYSMKDLQDGKEPECTVPHTPRSRGVVIETSCNKTVRVTDTHLMATPAGFQLAYSLKEGDKLFGDYDNKEICVVESVNKEKTVQTYFGLNCVHSEVLAAGVRASTFGDFHTLPSWYMYYVGGAVGVDRASAMGEFIAEWYYSM